VRIVGRRRLVLLFDSRSALEVLDAELESWRRWLHDTGTGDLSFAAIVLGTRAGWIPEGVTTLRHAAAVRLAGIASRPALSEAISLLAAAGPPHALITVLAADPEPGYEEELRRLHVPFRACVNTSPEPAAALGHGHLGAPFRGEHIALALRWLTRELYDRTWSCACGAVLVYPTDRGAACVSCGVEPKLPPRLRVRDRIVLMTAHAKLYPHHIGQRLAFDHALAMLDTVPPLDGVTTVAGEEVEIRTDPKPDRWRARRALRFRPPPIRAVPGMCHACETPLVSPVLQQPPDPRRFCATCSSHEARCDFCAVPLGPRGANLWPDGRAACRECWSTAVTEASDLATLEAMARAWMSARLAMEMPPCPLHFAHAAAIARMHGRTFRPVAGFNARPVGFFRKPDQAEDAAVFIEHGTPRSFAYGVVVHELTHLWQWHNWKHDRGPTLVEGLAMWVEYQALLDVGAIHAARNAERYGDPVYGLGFRLALAIEKEAGFARVKERMHDVVGFTVR
jgi:hypothetical protein